MLGTNSTGGLISPRPASTALLRRRLGVFGAAPWSGEPREAKIRGRHGLQPAAAQFHAHSVLDDAHLARTRGFWGGGKGLVCLSTPASLLRAPGSDGRAHLERGAIEGLLEENAVGVILWQRCEAEAKWSTRCDRGQERARGKRQAARCSSTT